MSDSQPTCQEPFVGYLLDHLGGSPRKRNTGMVARMKRADNPDTTWQAWDTLAAFGIDIERPERRLPYCLVGAAVCREDCGVDGTLGLGSALAMCFDNAEKRSTQGSLRLRRLLACSDMTELCRVLRPTLSLIASRAGGRLSYARLLNELNMFARGRREYVLARWAKDFWRKGDETEEIGGGKA